ncbi:cache domain-containing sensor histidine kinase [Cohnella sp. 56]|uniref:cache domain-containing sensor histidine kinase n=1 Tax=Cohnella sp. 56 TaxID=3113722 RepID=UPI0030E99DCD
MKLVRGFGSLRSQLVLSYMLISVLVLSAGTYYVYSFMLNQIRAQNERLLLQQFQQVDHNIHGVVSEVDRLSNLFWLDEQIQYLLQNISDKQDVDFVNYQNLLQNRIESFIFNYNYIHSIYLTAEKQGVVGGNAVQTLVQTEEEWVRLFFQSDAYLESQREFPKLIVQGNVKESYYNPYRTGASDATLVSMLRGVRSVYEPRTSGTLIFNIDEHYLASVYASDLRPEDGAMYIVDKQGIIVSGSSKDKIGTASAFVPQREGADYGSRNEKDRNVQLVYYKLQDAGWYILKEVPLRLYTDQIYKMQRAIALFFIASLLIMFALSYVWLRKIMKPLHVLSGKMKDMSRGELGVTFEHVPDNELGTVIRRFNEMSLSIVELIDKNNSMQEQKRETEIESLQYQINPHFLYNTLNMVRWMANMKKTDDIERSIVALGNLLRPVFSSKDPMCELRDELAYLTHYISIINMRFNDSVEFDIDVDEATAACLVPRFILQPLVENSIASGQREEEQEIFISIHAESDGEELRIVVSDSGKGIAPGLLEQLNRSLASGEAYESAGGGSGIGLRNVNSRIRLYFGEQYGLRFVPRDRGAEVVVRMPSLTVND